MQYKNILAMIFNEIKCHVNTSRSGGGMHPLHSPAVSAPGGPPKRGGSRQVFRSPSLKSTPLAVGYALGRTTIVVNPSDSLSKYFCKASDSESICLVRKELSICISHAFQVESTQIYFDTYFPYISNCWARPRVYRKLHILIGVNVQKSLRTTALR